MNKYYNMKLLKSNSIEYVLLNPCISELIDKKFITISFGSKSYFTKCSVLNSLTRDEIIIPEQLYDKLMIIDNIDYNFKIVNNQLRIGPLIGLLLYKKNSSLTENILNKTLKYTKYYNYIGGVISTFSLEKMDFSRMIIEGYVYQPNKKCFIKSLIPFPDSIFRLTKFDRHQQDLLISIIGNRFYNNYFFDKWELYEFFKDSIYSKYLPKTFIIDNYNHLIELLKEYNDMFLKPINNSQGNKVISISLRDNYYIISEVSKMIKFQFNDQDKFLNYISDFYNNSKFIAQQSIDLLEYNNKKIDFRVIMQKDINGNWICLGIIARFGQKGSIVSNISKGGVAVKFSEFCSLFNLNQRKLYNEIENLSICLCNHIDRIGLNCGNFGIDIGIDKNFNFWLIEINNIYPDHTIALDANDSELYDKIKANTLLYAKFLSGF